MVDAVEGHSVCRDVAIAGPGELDELVSMVGRNLPIELSLHDDDGLADLAHRVGRVEGQKASKPRRVCLPTKIGRNIVPPPAGDHRLMNLPLQVYLGVSLDQGIHSAVEHTPLLLEHQFGADDAWRGDERKPSDFLLLGRGEQSHPSPLHYARLRRSAVGRHPDACPDI